MIRALKLKQMGEELILYRNIFGEMKKQRSQKFRYISIKLR